MCGALYFNTLFCDEQADDTADKHVGGQANDFQPGNQTNAAVIFSPMPVLNPPPKILPNYHM